MVAVTAVRGRNKERERESDIFSQCTDRGHVSTEGKMTVVKGEHPDMCVSLSGPNRLVHPHPDECRETGEKLESKGDEGEDKSEAWG